MPVVVVESPAKAQTINKYLGSDYTVLASFGHVRDLPPKDGSVDPDADFAMKWEASPEGRKHLGQIATALKKDNDLILATDPDREGEAISWHLEQSLRGRRAIRKDTPVKRVVFNAITKSAVTAAMKNPRQIDSPLVEAYLARRALDYLVGFNISPILWRKLPGARSAGRVQSVSLRLVVEREMEIEAFKPVEYWSVKARLITPRNEEYDANLVSFAGTRLKKRDLGDATRAEMAVQAVKSRDLAVTSVESKPIFRSPSAPFMTSTLQQEAMRKLGMNTRKTMSAAQKLYEAGLITYMRTDGIDMAPEAVKAARSEISSLYGDLYVPKSPRMYKNKAKNAQEAHECIRPTDMSRNASKINVSETDQRRLYDLVWKRTIACQMQQAKLERTTAEIGSADGQVGLRASGQIVLFDGFLRVYEEGRDDQTDGEDLSRLPKIIEGEAAGKKGVFAERHFTQPPPRYNEATLVKKMEEIGIGRPSTYSSIVSTIQERGYVKVEKNRLSPENMGRLVTMFLLNFFEKYVEYEFTANLEEKLDVISAGNADYKKVLSDFWRDFHAAVTEAHELRTSNVLTILDKALETTLYPPREDGEDPRKCPRCAEGRLHLKPSQSGGFIGCSRYPDCNYTRNFGSDSQFIDARVLGEDAGDQISLRSGRYGPFVQRGEAGDGNRPPRASIPKGWKVDEIDLRKALQLLSLPRNVGNHPEDGQPIEAGIGRYGPYVRHGNVYANLKDANEVWTIGMNRAVEELSIRAASRKGGQSAPEPMRKLGDHPERGGEIRIMDGRYGPYVKWDKINATIPKDTSPNEVTMEMAVKMIEKKAAAKAVRKVRSRVK